MVITSISEVLYKEGGPPRAHQNAKSPFVAHTEMDCLESRYLKYLAIIGILAVVVTPPVIVTLLVVVKTVPPPGANMTYDLAKAYCDEHGMRLPVTPEELVFDWWTLADYEARNAKDGHAGINLFEFQFKLSLDLGRVLKR